MVSIRLPDGSSRSYDNPVTVAEVAASIGPGLAKAAVAGRVDGKLVDTSHRIDRDAGNGYRRGELLDGAVGQFDFQHGGSFGVRGDLG